MNKNAIANMEKLENKENLNGFFNSISDKTLHIYSTPGSVVKALKYMS